ncbi:MAG: precorrin-6A reductase [Eubacteriales bacterium]|nr:precorrin-6A reductase [Eubacteriales bacterium]
MFRAVVFAGTTEGRELAEFLERCQVLADVCVATEYGGQLLKECRSCRVHAGRLDAEGMESLLKRTAEDETVLAVDATHPYASEVTKNVKAACEAAGAEYIRLLRPSWKSAGDGCQGRGGEPEDGRKGRVTLVESVEDAVAFLEKTSGNILVTTGSKELHKFTALTDYQDRVFARVLSTPESVQASAQLGFTGKHLICMQGPFSEALNRAMLQQIDAKWLVTKESGKTGGFEEKIRAAKAAGAGVVLIGRPEEEQGLSLEEVKRYLAKRLKLNIKRKISLVGIGMGAGENMTLEAKRACEQAQLLIGAKRMLKNFSGTSQAKFVSYRPGEIRDYLYDHPEYERIALLQSGDVGFYSGAKGLLEALKGEEIEVYPGISSAVYFCAKLHIPWEDAKLVSLHGRSANVIAQVRENRKVFLLAGKGEGVNSLCRKLTEYGMGALLLSVGEELSYPEERIRVGTAEKFAKEKFSDLCVALIENPGAQPAAVHGIEDEKFLRDRVPMTKSEVRSISLSKLRLNRKSVVYDVGAGTGSVAVEAALQAAEGQVYAIEKKAEAAALIRANQKKFAADNLTVVEGLAPEALNGLPSPTHVFIGGSSGNLKEIMEAVLEKNPAVRIVVNCIALETAAEAIDCLRTLPVTDTDIVCVTVGKAKEAGAYHMMMGQNPVYVISCSGGTAV